MITRMRQALSQPVKHIKFGYFHARTYLGKVIGSRDFVRRRWSGDQTLDGARDIAVFVHFDKKGVVHDYVVEHLQAWVKAGFAVIFVTNSPKFEDRALDRVRPHVAQILHRHNRGYDFGSYRDAIVSLGELSRYNRLVLCNDSVYGPFRPLEDVLSECDPKTADMWGMTDSWQGRYHLQSYFLLFHNPALSNTKFQNRWRHFVHIDDKDWVVSKHEINLTGEMLEAGLKVRSLWRYSDQIDAFVKQLDAQPKWRDSDAFSPLQKQTIETMLGFAQGGVPMNINHFFWDKLLLEGYPFIKRDLVTANPMNLPYTFRWRWMIGQISDYDAELIVSHLESTMRNRSI